MAKTKEERAAYQKAYRKIYGLLHRKEQSARGKLYYATHRKKVLARCKKYRDTHKAEINRYHILHWEAHKKEITAHRKKYCRAHRALITAGEYRYRKNNPEKRAAHIAIKRLKRSRKLTALSCIVCKKIHNKNSKAHAHHSDYRKPLDVMWLCPTHHKTWHRIFKTGDSK